MSQQASQPVAKVDLRGQMPETAKWVDEKRQAWGTQHVNACIREGMAGKPGFFYAMERGLFLGTPFPSTHPVAQDQNFAVMCGCKFAAFIAVPPKGTTNGTN